MKPYSRLLTGSCITAGLLTLVACNGHQALTQSGEITSTHASVDINVKVDKALEDFFGDLDEIKKQ